MVSLTKQYQTQYQWRDWRRIYSELPDLRHKSVLDLGCAQGDISADLAAKGAQVTGIDTDMQLLGFAKARDIPNAIFIQGSFDDLSALKTQQFDVIWSSFSLAYFTNQPKILSYWRGFLKEGGIIVLTEMSHLLGQCGVYERYKEKIEAFYAEALSQGRYDFMAADKMAQSCLQTGYQIDKDMVLEDLELSPQGAASARVIAAWAQRFERMPALRKALGANFTDDFLCGLSLKNHETRCRVRCVIARK